LASAVSVTTTTSSQVFTLSATAETPAKAQAIANAVAKEFKEQIPKIMDVNNVTIVAEAPKGTKSFPKVKMITAGWRFGWFGNQPVDHHHQGLVRYDCS
jgi:capsular polysaccharide biosynthesis protein